MNNNAENEATALVEAMAQKLNSIKPNYHIKKRADGDYLVVEIVSPNERFFRALREAQRSLPEENPFRERATVSARSTQTSNRLLLPETQLLRATLSESLTVDKHTFSDDFLNRYITSVFRHEDQIVADGNHLVYGRRGSGKSSLLAYVMHHRRKQNRPYAWIGMQAYSGRDDIQVSIDVLASIVDQLLPFAAPNSQLAEMRQQLASMESAQKGDATKSLLRLLPRLGREVSALGAAHGGSTVFIDDLHVLAPSAQSTFLGHVYSVSRGNKCNLKISAIEQFAKPWDAKTNTGLQPPHDAQILKLDYNLTMPEKSKEHIRSILDAHASFSGLPSVSYIAGETVLSRLVLVAAAVPRDALSLFAQAIAKGTLQGQKAVSIMSVNAAASEMAGQKLNDIPQDRSGGGGEVQKVLERVKDFCIQKERKNAFLLEIANGNATYRAIQELIALRLVHVLHEGITPHQAGRRYQALLLDYGFYVGIRAAKSVDLFHREFRTPAVHELRKLPIFPADVEPPKSAAKKSKH